MKRSRVLAQPCSNPFLRHMLCASQSRKISRNSNIVTSRYIHPASSPVSAPRPGQQKFTARVSCGVAGGKVLKNVTPKLRRGKCLEKVLRKGSLVLEDN